METKNVRELVGCAYPQDKLNPYHYFWKTENKKFQKAFAYKNEYSKHYERIFQAEEYLIWNGEIYYLQETTNGLEIIQPFAITNGQKLLNAFPPSNFFQKTLQPLILVEAHLFERGFKENIGYYWCLGGSMYVPFAFSRQPKIDEKKHAYFFTPLRIIEQGCEGFSWFGLAWNYRLDEIGIPYLQAIDSYSIEDIKNYLIDDFLSIMTQIGCNISEIEWQRPFEEYNFKVHHVDWLLDKLILTYELEFPDAETFPNLESIRVFMQKELGNRLFI